MNTTQQIDLRKPLTTASTSLSIVGCIIIFLAHKFWKEARSSSRNILLYITIADLFTAVGYLFDAQIHWEDSCIFQSFVTTTSSLMSFFWTACMALYLHAVSIKANYELGKRIIFAFHCVAWPVPFLISLIALLAHKLGRGCTGIATGKWCWIKEDCINGTITTPRYENILWMLLTGKLWEIASYIAIIIVYARIFIYVRKQRKLVEDQSNSTTAARFRSVEKRTILIPAFYILIRIWGTLQFLIYAFSGIKYIQVLGNFQAFGDGAQGFVNAILFCLITDKAKLFLKKCFTRDGGERESLLPKDKSIQKSGDKQQPSNPI